MQSVVLIRKSSNMPLVSFYLEQKTLDAVRSRAKASDIPVSKIIREAVEQYLKVTEVREARERLLGLLVNEKPLGGMKAWNKLHDERTEADADRA